MCGIMGFNWRDQKLLRSCLAELKNRGPDDSGTFCNKEISLGHTRLSIIDLSKAGKQPMSNEDNSLWITFNGEIYNYKEIREGLKKRHTFKSNTDTEVLIHLYEEEGFNLVSKLIGMFAFCIYDSNKQLFFLARDRVGIKPLYYFLGTRQFMFSSEIRGILQNNEIRREINLDALVSYLIFRANTNEETFFKGIKKLMPGHYLVYDLRSNKISTKKYWDFVMKPGKENESELKDKLRYLIEDSVRIRLMSDVPYGVYLSGGVDSGTILSLVKKHSRSKKIKTFSVGFEENEDSEINAARFTAEYFGTEHHELLIKNSSIELLPEIIRVTGEPLADPTAIPIYFLSKYAKKHCTVILTGEGADEVFAGYPQYKFMKLRNYFLLNKSLQLREGFVSLLKLTPWPVLNRCFKFSSSLGDKGIERLSQFILSSKYPEQYLNQIAIFNEEEQQELLNKKVEMYEGYKKYFVKTDKLISNCQELDFREPMVEDLLMKIDKNTMAFGIEGRVPFLDHRIVELAAKIPESLKLKGFTKDKYILRKAISDLVPRETRLRKKNHFFVPIDSWLEKELGTLMERFLSRDYIRKQNIFNYASIEKMKDGFEKSKLFYSRQLWCLIVFQIWSKIYIENEKVRI